MLALLWVCRENVHSNVTDTDAAIQDLVHDHAALSEATSHSPSGPVLGSDGIATIWSLGTEAVDHEVQDKVVAGTAERR